MPLARMGVMRSESKVGRRVDRLAAVNKPAACLYAALIQTALCAVQDVPCLPRSAIRRVSLIETSRQPHYCN